MPARAGSAALTRPAPSPIPPEFEVSADDWALVERYRFGSRTADYLVCRRCGVYVAALCETSTGLRAVVNINCLSDRDQFSQTPSMPDYEGEAVAARLARRAANWMPAVVKG